MMQKKYLLGKIMIHKHNHISSRSSKINFVFRKALNT